MISIGTDEIRTLRYAIQYFQDCYLVSSIGALTKSANGRKILSENIRYTNDGFCIKFKNINGNCRDFFVTQKDLDNLVYMDKFKNPIPINNYFPHNPIIKAIEVAMNKLLNKFPSKKPLICKFPDCNEKFEFNKPSNFLEMFTGKKPVIINESSIRLSLKSREKESMDIFNRINENPDNSFVAGTLLGFHKGLSDYHCYSISRADKKHNILELFDHRALKTTKLSFDEAIKKLKFLVGYFDDDLM